MNAIISILLSTIAVMATAYILPGVHVASFLTAMVVAIALAVATYFIFPLLLILTLPINILTMGLFTFVIIGLLVLGISAIVPGFQVDGFFWALLFAFIFTILNAFIRTLTP